MFASAPIVADKASPAAARRPQTRAPGPGALAVLRGPLRDTCLCRLWKH